MEPRIQFATTSDGVSIAFETLGSGPPLVKAANWLSHLEFEFESPVWRHWFDEMSRGRHLVRYDERGCGLSDWNDCEFGVEAWVRDLEAVVEAVGLERFDLLGISQGGPVAIAYAVRHPESVGRLILFGTYARGWRHRGESAEQLEEHEALMKLMSVGWGRDNPAYRHIFTTAFTPGASPEQMHWFDELQRVSTSATNAVRFMNAFGDVEVTSLLPAVRVPTLVLHAREDQQVPFEEGRRVAAGIRGARFVPLEGRNHLLLADEPAWAIFVREVNRFLAGDNRAGPATAEAGPSSFRTILFTDLEGHTQMMSRLGDAKGRAVLREHERITRECLRGNGGAEVKTMGDGFMASFASAQKALECAISLQQALSAEDSALAGMRVRVGINAGEPIAEDDDLFGTSVIVAARVAARATGGQVLVSNVVRELVAGKGFLFSDTGEHVLKGMEDPVRVWELRWEER